MNTDDLLGAYDAGLRTASEMLGADAIDRRGPLWLARFGDLLFVTYRELDDPAARVAEVRALIDADPTIGEAEWKTRGHDVTLGLDEALERHGFQRDETESVMLGEAASLVGVPAPEGVTIRRVEAPDDILAALAMQDAVFGGSYAPRLHPELLRRIADGELIEVWIAEADGRIVSAGRIDPVPGTAFAGIWGGSTLPEYRGRGIYRALTSARATSVMRHGVRFVHSDSTDESRPILERAGLVKVTTTTPWRWKRT